MTNTCSSFYGNISMDKYTNVNVDKLANIYFEGKVISRNIFFKDGSRKTLGVMLPGKYKSNTNAIELMEIISGNLSLKLEIYDDSKLIKRGMNFNVPKNSSFEVEILEVVNYICSYFDD